MFKRTGEIANELALLRSWSTLSQSGFAAAMGVPLRTYEDLEAQRTAIRPVHLQAARMALIQLSVTQPDSITLPMPLNDFIKATEQQHQRNWKKMPSPTLPNQFWDVYRPRQDADLRYRNQFVFAIPGVELPGEISSNFERDGNEEIVTPDIGTLNRINQNGYVILPKPKQ